MPDSPPASALQTEQLQRVVDTLVRVSDFMNEVTDLDRLLTLIMGETARLMGSEASACMLYDDTADELYFQAATGEKADGVKAIRLSRGQGFAWAAFLDQKTQLVNNVAADKRHFQQADKKAEFTTRNLIATPMVYREEKIGVLEVLNTSDGRDYSEQDATLLELIADQAALAISNARLVEASIRQERLQAIGMAVSGIAHHLKNIIVSVKGPLSLIRMGVQRNKPEVVENSLGVLERGAQRMEHSVMEMLAYSKEREPELQAGSLNELLEEIAESSRERAARAGVALHCELDPALPVSLIDGHRLHDALLNLVGNAVEAHGERPPEGAQVTLRSRLGQQGKTLVAEVEDNGPGMPAETLARIFQPFFSTKGSRGTGLGLAVAQKVAEENGGRLEAESEPGRGSCFRFVLPLRPLKD